MKRRAEFPSQVLASGLTNSHLVPQTVSMEIRVPEDHLFCERGIATDIIQVHFLFNRHKVLFES